jgi:hypothetical protein
MRNGPSRAPSSASRATVAGDISRSAILHAPVPRMAVAPRREHVHGDRLVHPLLRAPLTRHGPQSSAFASQKSANHKRTARCIEYLRSIRFMPPAADEETDFCETWTREPLPTRRCFRRACRDPSPDGEDARLRLRPGSRRRPAWNRSGVGSRFAEPGSRF